MDGPDTSSAPLKATLDRDYDDDVEYTLGGTMDPVSYTVKFFNLSEDERSYLVNTFTSNRRRHRRRHQSTLQAAERRASKIARLRALFLQNTMWAAEGGNIAIKDMTPNHALNSYNLITREWVRYAGWAIKFSDLETGHANIHGTPLAIALYERSQKRTTRRDKRKDTESRERFKDRLAKGRAVAGAIWAER